MIKVLLATALLVGCAQVNEKQDAKTKVYIFKKEQPAPKKKECHSSFWWGCIGHE